MKNTKRMNAIKGKSETENKKYTELTEDELAQVSGGLRLRGKDGYDLSMASCIDKLSTGMKINSSADDPSGYQISERMRVRLRGMDDVCSYD